MLAELFAFYRGLSLTQQEVNRRKAKIETIFRKDNLLQGLDGRQYRVVGTELCFAILLDLRTHRQSIVDWLTPAGTIRDEVADRFDLVQPA